MSAKSIPPAASSDKSTQPAAVSSWRDHLKVHPAAALFPRMTEAELRELGEDIKRNGLRQKCVRLIVPHLGALLLDGSIEWTPSSWSTAIQARLHLRTLSICRRGRSKTRTST